MLKKAGVLLLICAGLSTWISCVKTSSHYLYAAVPASAEIYVYREDPNSGILSELSLSPIAAGLGVESLVLHPSNKFLYAANSSEGDVSLFTISSDGALNEVTPRTTVGVAPTVLAIDTAGAYLYVANSESNDISVFSIDASSGQLTPVPNSPFSIGLTPINLKLAPSGILYVTGQGVSSGEIQAFTVSNGQLTLLPGSPFQTGNNPVGLAISPDGYLYTANSLDNSISEFSIATAAAAGVVPGDLMQLTGSPIGEVNQSAPLALLVSNSGNYLCVANEGLNNLAVYSIGTNGSLTALTSSPFSSDTGPAFIASDPNGEYLFVGTQGSPQHIQPFGLAGDGALTSVASYQIPGTPTSVVVVP
jgi:6-phosphogluconolactonase